MMCKEGKGWGGKSKTSTVDAKISLLYRVYAI